MMYYNPFENTAETFSDKCIRTATIGVCRAAEVDIDKLIVKEKEAEPIKIEKVDIIAETTEIMGQLSEIERLICFDILTILDSENVDDSEVCWDIVSLERMIKAYRKSGEYVFADREGENLYVYDSSSGECKRWGGEEAV